MGCQEQSLDEWRARTFRLPALDVLQLLDGPGGTKQCSSRPAAVELCLKHGSGSATQGAWRMFRMELLTARVGEMPKLVMFMRPRASTNEVQFVSAMSPPDQNH